VNCKGAYQGIFLQGLPEMMLENVRLENIKMESDFGLKCLDAKNVKIKNLTFKIKNTPAIDLKNSTDITIDGLVTLNEASPLIHVSGSRTGNMKFKNVGITNPEKQVIIEKEVSKDLVKLTK
jgi:polygalacturonase